MEWKSGYRKWLCGLLGLSLLLIGVYYYNRIMQVIPDHITIEAGNPYFLKISEQPDAFFREEVIQTSGSDAIALPKNAVSIEVEQQEATRTDRESYTVECKFLGILGMKNVQVDVIEDQKLYAGGFPVGIYVETDGIMVIGSGKVTGVDGIEYEPARNILKSGDYITSINGKEVSTKEEFVNIVNEEGANPVVLGIRRNGEETKVKIVPVQTAKEEYRLGAWIRDNTQGVGMLTFMTQSGKFGALGHGITDIDTGLLMNIEEGRLLDTEIVSVVKGRDGTPGELVGMIDYRMASRLGTVLSNTSNGIFGDADAGQCSSLCSEAMPIAMKKDIRSGAAKIRTCVDGTIKEYDIEILEVYPNSREENKSFLIEITDEELLEKTGGIVQGMSGSPVIQDGRIVGAVTHVLVQDSSRGYGIFIEEMLKECG